MRKPKRRSVTAKSISPFVFATSIVLPNFRNSRYLAIFFDCTTWFVSDLVGNPIDRFSHVEAQMRQVILLLSTTAQIGLCRT